MKDNRISSGLAIVALVVGAALGALAIPFIWLGAKLHLLDPDAWGTERSFHRGR